MGRMVPLTAAVFATVLAASAPVAPCAADLALPRVDPPAPTALYSHRALRRTRLILQLQVLELRREGLERLAQRLEAQLDASEVRPMAPARMMTPERARGSTDVSGKSRACNEKNERRPDWPPFSMPSSPRQPPSNA